MNDSFGIGDGMVKREGKRWEGNQPACASVINRLRTPQLFIPASRQETRSEGASYAPLKWIQIVTLFRYPTSLVVALAGGSAYNDLDRIGNALSIGEMILRPEKAPAQGLEN